MKEKIFHRMPCLSESAEITAAEIEERLFDKKCGRRGPEHAVEKFIRLNKKMLSFLGVNVEKGSGSSFSIKFVSSGFVGAIPIRMPYDGLAHKDFQVFPKFGKSEKCFPDLTRLLSKLDYSISPEYKDGEKLTQPYLLRPPMYYEAAKYIDEYARASKTKWVKFEVAKGVHNFPKASTNWNKYAQTCSDPRKALKYPSSDSLLTINHKEMRELKYVFEMAKSTILQPSVPGSLKYRYLGKIDLLQRALLPVSPRPTSHVVIHASDPTFIKKAKEQANVLLQNSSTFCVSAWRIDMSQLFERYVQHVVTIAAKEKHALVKANEKIHGQGKIPQWGLKYLEPDIIIKLNDSIFIADAKYKAHNYAFFKNSDTLKSSHRADLHQILAYCSFSPQQNKTGILFYPSDSWHSRKIQYTEKMSRTCNTVILCGIPFGADQLDDAVKSVKDLLSSEDFSES